MPETLAFDLYGTLVDPLRIAQQLERALGSAAQRTAELWRMKQLEYTFRLTAMQRYEDFEQVTAKALDYALAVVGHELSAGDRRGRHAFARSTRSAGADLCHQATYRLCLLWLFHRRTGRRSRVICWPATRRDRLRDQQSADLHLC